MPASAWWSGSTRWSPRASPAACICQTAARAFAAGAIAPLPMRASGSLVGASPDADAGDFSSGGGYLVRTQGRGDDRSDRSSLIRNLSSGVNLMKKQTLLILLILTLLTIPAWPRGTYRSVRGTHQAARRIHRSRAA